jgi:hypothetical protein
MAECTTTEPVLYTVGDTRVRCLLYAEQLRDAV